ncbi:uncharacterized protein LOC125751222 isoform X1 [Brienomyrus brachyistius]|uniref:uncharacterized protein LOC125751222 isoform X1 n=1 Tax=Brienomyrus brachyistius TaxID=42636 RepID=UPI0020B1BEE6|nr:uncharacterized protein LOC125751222 isoform X1 [Brienomyrus brachyistius]
MDIQAHLLSWAILSFLSGETSANLQCCKAGGTVYLHIQNRSQKLRDIRWKHENNIKFENKSTSSAEIFQNWTLKISNIQKNWTGDITASGYDSDGKHVLTETHHLVVLGHPVVEFLTCTHGTSVFYCADDSGEDTLYTWTVRDEDLGKEKVFSNSSKHISVEVISGSVHCTVQKKSCSAQSKPVSFNCTKTPTAWCPTALTSVSVLMPCLTVAGISFCFLRWYKKHRLSAKSENSSVSPTPVNEDIVYSEVRVAKQCR